MFRQGKKPLVLRPRHDILPTEGWRINGGKKITGNWKDFNVSNPPLHMPDIPNISVRQMSYPVFIAPGIEVSGVLQTQKYLAIFCNWWLLSTPRKTRLLHSRSKSTFHPLQTSSCSLCASQLLGPSVLLSRRGNWGWKCCPWAVEQVSVKVSTEISGRFTSLPRHRQGTPVRAVYETHT